MGIRLASTGRASITLHSGEVPAVAGAPFEVESEEQAERLVRKGYAVRVEEPAPREPEQPIEKPAKGRKQKGEG